MESPPPDSDSDSVTAWIDRLKNGNPTAAQPLWERYFAQLVHLAEQRLSRKLRSVADEEDIALSAFQSFCRATQAGRFPQLNNRDDLWRLLVSITDAKTKNHVRNQQRQKRGGGTVTHVSELAASGDDSLPELWISREPSPEYAATLADEVQTLIARLQDPTLRNIVVRNLEGQSKEEIAKSLGVSIRTIERKLQLIRTLWEAEGN